MSSLSKSHDAGNRLDEIVRQIQHDENKTYDEALKVACSRNPELTHRYALGESNVRQYDLSPTKREMVLLQADPERVNFFWPDRF